jgi:lipoyl(octanoyl) transferase
MTQEVLVRNLGYVEYLDAWRAMQQFCDERDSSTIDEIWLLEHPPVYTVGLRGKGRELPNPHGIPLIYSDRGGDVTYHGPGQVVAYVLADLRRRNWGVRQLVHSLEQAVIDLLAQHGIAGERRAGAPGVYVHHKKLAALGLRVRNGRSYHGLALNVNLDLRPFASIDPCGYKGLEVTRTLDLGIDADVARTNRLFLPHLLRNLGYRPSRHTTASVGVPA